MAGNETDDVLGAAGAECRNNDSYARVGEVGHSDSLHFRCSQLIELYYRFLKVGAIRSFEACRLILPQLG